MTRLLVLLALTLVACGAPPPDPHPHLRIDSRLPYAEVLAGIGDLIAVTDGGFAPKSVERTSPMRANVRWISVEELGYMGGEFRWDWNIEGKVDRRIVITDGGVRRATIHELIHWAGLPWRDQHSHAGAFAARGPSGEICVSQETVDELCAVIECGAKAGALCPEPTSTHQSKK